MHVHNVAALKDGVALADGVGLVVYLLRVCNDSRFWVDLGHAIGKARERPARSGAGITDLHDTIGLREVIHLTDNEQLDRETQTVAWAEVLACGLVGRFGELPD